MRVFLSYRQADSFDVVDRIEAKLRERLAGVEIFRDKRSLQSGDKWLQTIIDEIESCDFMLVVIGPKWLTIEKGGQRRLDDPNDTVRREVATGLSRRIPLIPVLVLGAAFPEVQRLPQDLQNLGSIHAHRIRTESFDADLSALIKRIGLLLDIEIREVSSPKGRRAVSILLEELDGLTERDPTGLDFESYWRWFLKAKEVLQSVATGTETEQELHRLELVLMEARDADEGMRELTMMEVGETLEKVRGSFSTQEELASDKEAEQRQYRGPIELPGVGMDKFSPVGTWQCDVSGAGEAYSHQFQIADDYSVTGSMHLHSGQNRMVGRCMIKAWSPPEDDGKRWVGGRPNRVIGIRLEGVLNGREPFDIEIPIAEGLGAGYRGIDEQGRTYFLRRP